MSGGRLCSVSVRPVIIEDGLFVLRRSLFAADPLAAGSGGLLAAVCVSRNWLQTGGTALIGWGESHGNGGMAVPVVVHVLEWCENIVVASRIS